MRKNTGINHKIHFTYSKSGGHSVDVHRTCHSTPEAREKCSVDVLGHINIKQSVNEKKNTNKNKKTCFTYCKSGGHGVDMHKTRYPALEGGERCSVDVLSYLNIK